MKKPDKNCDVLTGLKVIDALKQGVNENIQPASYVGEWSSVRIWPRSTSLSSLPLPTTEIKY